MKEYFVSTEAEMIQLGYEFIQKIGVPSIIAIVGELGAGKTHFTKGVAKFVGREDVTSPTFSLVNEVLGDETSMYHFDFYRIKREEELLDLGWDEYLQQGGVIVAEWANLFPQLMPDSTHWIKIEHAKGGRTVTIA